MFSSTSDVHNVSCTVLLSVLPVILSQIAFGQNRAPVPRAAVDQSWINDMSAKNRFVGTLFVQEVLLIGKYQLRLFRFTVVLSRGRMATSLFFLGCRLESSFREVNTRLSGRPNFPRKAIKTLLVGGTCGHTPRDHMLTARD